MPPRPHPRAAPTPPGRPRARAAHHHCPRQRRRCPRARAVCPTAPAPPARPCQRPVHSPQRSKQQPAGRSREAKPLRRADGDSSTRRDSTASTQDRGAGLQDGSERLQLRIICLHQVLFGVTQSTDFTELANQEPWLSSMKLVLKPDMLFGKRGKSGLVALKLDLAQVRQFVKERLGVEVEMGGCKAPITTFIVEPFVPHDQEYYLSIVSERLGSTISFSECGGIEIEENWDKVRTKIGDFIRGVFSVFQDLDFSFLEMNPFTLVNGEPYPLDMRGELDDTAAFKNFNKYDSGF
ncbi:unnamed protein product [Miscanthus lutarioriparius]|uniref:ATP-citrate synthase ATP-grasp domain-containing protein n=1 Tax=Miscanthus lutarioriparius TaxID=422564 RepID=A0A811QN49_9POAL|nr:unnamed protein product [Miscanthus lutarioriparius]